MVIKYKFGQLITPQIFLVFFVGLTLSLLSNYSYADCAVYPAQARSSNLIILGAGIINGPVKSITTTTNSPDKKNNIIIRGQYDLSPCGDLDYFLFEITEGYSELQNRMRSEGHHNDWGYQLLFTSELIKPGGKTVTLINANSRLLYNQKKQITQAIAENDNGKNTPVSQLSTEFFYENGQVTRAVTQGDTPDEKGEILYDWNDDHQINAIISQTDGLPQLNYEFTYNDNRQVIGQTQTQHSPLGLVKSIYLCQQLDAYGNCEKALWQSVSEGNKANNLIVINTAIVTSVYTYY
ncbi:hypothetical protein [Morganella psychrotolerans]|uniref:Uncharacterized protein n=1 Tax=Morganella psychrotolerans TaxID=368603 RepID=A0A1B8HBE1_9GAMM|nr:hypothetical protein [Morganella psychrotolerans]OBU06385.1 hypothetical protein AYY18_07900 [Morganella psychrotolerans]